MNKMLKPPAIDQTRPLCIAVLAMGGQGGAELMEAGRAIQRGLVTPDKTTLIASSHRSFAVQEKLVPGDGISDSAKVYEAAETAAKRFVAFDMADLAESTGSAISAV